MRANGHPQGASSTRSHHRATSPDLADLLAHHRVAFLASERLCELGHIRERPVATESRQGVRVRVRLQSRILQPLVRTPDLGPTQKKSLLGRESILIRRTR